MANIRVHGSYRTYRWIKKNPVIDVVRTIVDDNGLMKNLTALHEISGVSTAALHGWFFGDTKNPQHATVMAVVTALGYEEKFVRAKTVDIEAERKAGKQWLEQRKKEREEAKEEEGKATAAPRRKVAAAKAAPVKRKAKRRIAA